MESLAKNAVPTVVIGAELSPTALQIDSDIHYLVAVPDWQPNQATPLQGFSPSLCFNTFLIRAAALLPSNIFDPSPEGRQTLLARKLGGTDPVNWHPQSPRAIRSIPLPAQLPFVIVMLGKDQEAEEYFEWSKACEVRPTIVAEKGGDIGYSDLVVEMLQTRLLTACDQIPASIDPEFVANATKAIVAWAPLPSRSLGFKVGGHATVTPNLMALTVFGFDDLVDAPFKNIDKGNDPYVDQIVATTRSVFEERRRVAITAAHPTFPRFPDLNIFAPAMYPHAAQLKAPDFLDPAVKRSFKTALNVLTHQSGYNFEIRTDHQQQAVIGVSRADLAAKGAKPAPHPIFRTRQLELALATECMSALAASDLSATLRLSNDINRTAGSVRQFAAHYRGDNRNSRKRLLAFRQVSDRIAGAIPSSLIDLLRESEDGIRIIADAHIEWLDVDGLPLAIRKNVSRIPVTPGNLFVDQTTAKPLLRLTPDHFRNILVINALKRADPIKRMFEIAFETFGKEWQDAINVRFVDVSSEDGLVAAFSQFDGPLAIFDGHGSHRPGYPAVLHLQDAECDVWKLHGRIQSPPIVLLSACDTHAADRNHATTASGFLALGARAVLGSVFPLNAASAAAFTARLIYRVAKFIPAAVGLFGRALSWTEVVSGMVRMQLLTDFLRQLMSKKLIDEATYHTVHERGNMAINGLSTDPFAQIIEILAGHGLDAAVTRRELELAIANSSAISYINMGRPETIAVDTDERMQRWAAEIASTELTGS